MAFVTAEINGGLPFGSRRFSFPHPQGVEFATGQGGSKQCNCASGQHCGRDFFVEKNGAPDYSKNRGKQKQFDKIHDEYPYPLVGEHRRHAVEYKAYSYFAHSGFCV
ncbi:hypothetical protein [Herbaspirillum autotrophicum]|uniref:hypothetical protein n=1 Tax=Herbaspirillum autotrophicum TaxID=180195 RepID=UPI0012ED7023